MIIIAHRGFWDKKNKQNTEGAFLRALGYGYGIELDVAAYKGKVAVAHNTLISKACGLNEIFRKISSHNNFRKIIYAINIKSDGIEDVIANMVYSYGLKPQSFVFDMSVPSQYIFSKEYSCKVRIACRHSDVEKELVLYNRAKWVWMDEFNRHWIDNKTIIRHIGNNKMVCLVSPELHARNHLKAWRQYAKLPPEISAKTAICTDFPADADYFFNYKGSS